MKTVEELHLHVTGRSTMAAILSEIPCLDLASPVVSVRSLDRSRQLAQAPALLSQVELRDLALDRIRQGLCVFDKQQRLLSLCARAVQVPASAMLLRQADMALYQAKAQGGGTCCFFQADAL